MSGFALRNAAASYNRGMVHLAALSTHPADGGSASAAGAGSELPALDEALLVLLAKRLAHALLLDTPLGSSSREPTHVASASTNSHL
jgi:hypothetical protein